MELIPKRRPTRLTFPSYLSAGTEPLNDSMPFRAVSLSLRSLAAISSKTIGLGGLGAGGLGAGGLSGGGTASPSAVAEVLM